jgi:hypothetical protein
MKSLILFKWGPKNPVVSWLDDGPLTLADKTLLYNPHCISIWKALCYITSICNIDFDCWGKNAVFSNSQLLRGAISWTTLTPLREWGLISNMQLLLYTAHAHGVCTAQYSQAAQCSDIQNRGKMGNGWDNFYRSTERRNVGTCLICTLSRGHNRIRNTGDHG